METFLGLSAPIICKGLPEVERPIVVPKVATSIHQRTLTERNSLKMQPIS